jgi:protoheme IX farnesyltransferase
MMPVIVGDAATYRQMFWYTVVTVAASLALAWSSGLGVPYTAAAAVLGGVFLEKTWRLWRRGGGLDATWSLYQYSLLYLALLFTMMMVDRVLAS